jgi:hypothetical protein
MSQRARSRSSASPNTAARTSASIFGDASDDSFFTLTRPFATTTSPPNASACISSCCCIDVPRE